MKLKTPTSEEVEKMLSDKSFRGSATVGLMAFLQDNDPVKMKTLFHKVYQEWRDQLKLPSGKYRAIALQTLVDFYVKGYLENGLEASCKKGCAHCCHLEVSISHDEAELLAGLVNSGRVNIDIGRLRKQSEIPTLMDGTSAWRELPSEVRRCVFLRDDSLCGIYEQRPAACRKYFVRTPPEYCKDIKGKSQIVSVLEAEVVVSAAYNLEYSGPDSIAKKLLPLIQSEDSHVV